ncbi:hypothetical protein LTR78_009011 [Recurvomyces mirabilis]|uniref:Uncharacterized protein n=1 Tax=Recurvomyces mirabilis TaxID=574656 RepID=A0AAE0WIL1_9PEZI|nr:hypothetical protein LTR78_009011 [Recurvomyces mirabilis]KAK5150461.1 hypothetical protein LTS14_010151 [Recurvomyces mirabilis]
MATSTPTFDTVYTHLTTRYGFPVLPHPSAHGHDKILAGTISDLSIHPTLEAILHILNADLSSAHFLCRHMQNRPAYEGMYIHGLLHRVEGDYRNAEAWYGDVSASDAFRSAWPGESGLDDAKAFIGRVEKLRKQKVGDAKKIEEQSRKEIEALVGWCKEKFGVGRVEDATTVWVKPGEKEREIAAKMLVGGEGWRQF